MKLNIGVSSERVLEGVIDCNHLDGSTTEHQSGCSFFFPSAAGLWTRSPMTYKVLPLGDP